MNITDNSIKKPLHFLKDHISSTKLNLLGKSVSSKLLIIESDDWGAVRTPSASALVEFSKVGMDVEKSFYRNDAIASNEDIELLFNLLSSIKDRYGNHPVITANIITGNPDFDAIIGDSFSNYYYEPFTHTVEKYPDHDRILSLWKSGIEQGVFYPQFHGREHVNTSRWLKALRNGDKFTRFAFNFGSTYSGVGDYSYMESLDWDTFDQIEEQKTSIAEGLDIFNDAFGFYPASFIAPCYCWDPELEGVLQSKGVSIIQGSKTQKVPTGKYLNYEKKKRSFGSINHLGQIANVRNVFFEPSLNYNKDWVDSALNRIQNAFLFNKPAVITSHRINYVGFISNENRNRGLNKLEELLKKLLAKWPDVKFIHTAQLPKYL